LRIALRLREARAARKSSKVLYPSLLQWYWRPSRSSQPRAPKAFQSASLQKVA
jgi:hypothetical protein